MNILARKILPLQQKFIRTKLTYLLFSTLLCFIISLAFAPLSKAQASMTVTVTNTSGVGVTVKTVVLDGATETGGASVNNNKTGAPNFSLAPNYSNSLPMYAIYDGRGGSSGEYKAETKNTLLDNNKQVDAFSDGYYNGAVTANKSVTLGSSTPTNDLQLWSAYEVPSSSNSTPNIDASTPGVANSGASSSTTTTASFTPPAGSVIVLLITANANTNQTASVTVANTGGLAFTQRAQESVTSNGYTAIYTATVGSSPTPTATPTPQPTATPTPTRAPVAQMVSNTKEINYYPPDNGWSNMWTNFNPTEINTDFQNIASLGFNTVRIVLQAVPGAFDYPQPTSTELNNLSQVISLASNNNLKVHLTLFDWWNSFSDITGSKEWANAVVQPYAGDYRVSMIEVKNEVDPGYAAEMTWTETMLPYLQSISGGIPVTVSVTGGDANLQSMYTQFASASVTPDFWDQHIYEYDGLVYNTLNTAKGIVNNQPLFIGETGYTTYAGPSVFQFSNAAQNTPNEEAEQEYYFRQIDYAAEALNLPLASPWIYSDFTPTATVSGQNLGPDQYYNGLYRTDGTKKASATTIQSINAGNAIDTSFNNGFEQEDGSLPTVWREWSIPSEGFTANFAWDDTVAHSGTASAEMSDSTQSPNGIAGYYLNPIQYVKPNQQYTLSAWAKGLNATGDNFVSIGWFDNNHTYISQSSSQDLPTGTTNWQQLSVTATAPANAATMELHLNSQGNSGNVWYDDVSFTAP